MAFDFVAKIVYIHWLGWYTGSTPYMVECSPYTSMHWADKMIFVVLCIMIFFSNSDCCIKVSHLILRQIFTNISLPTKWCLISIFLVFKLRESWEKLVSFHRYHGFCFNFFIVSGDVLTLSWRRSLSYRNQSDDLLCKRMNWFLYNGTSVIKEFRLYQTSTIALFCGKCYRLCAVTTTISHIMAINIVDVCWGINYKSDYLKQTHTF